jgi:hypothetical protein
MKNSEMTFATPDNPKSQQQIRRIAPDHQASVSRVVCGSSRAGGQTPWLWHALLPICAAALVNLAACSTQSGSMSVQGKPVSGYVEMTQVQAAYLGSGNAGNGTLRYRGHTYPFSVGGLGVGGIGISKIEARGEVYGLERLRDFPGAYVQGRYGLALGTVSTGDLWLQNGNGVIMRLVAKRQGLMLSLGGDAVVIQMNQ